MNERSVTYWLRKSPRPVAILADEKRIEVPNNARAWRDLTETIKSLEPSKLTALDAKGNVIRSVVLEEDGDSKQSPSPEMSDLQLFAKLLAEAYDKASSKMQPIVDSAMAFVERGGTRLAKVENENERLRIQNHKLHIQVAELTGAAAPADESVLGALMAGALQSGLNGTGHPVATDQKPAPLAAKQGSKK